MVVDLSCDEALEASERLLLGESVLHPSLDVVARYDLNLWIGHPLEGATYLPR
jgi:hypothetical protein